MPILVDAWETCKSFAIEKNSDHGTDDGGGWLLEVKSPASRPNGSIKLCSRTKTFDMSAPLKSNRQNGIETTVRDYSLVDLRNKAAVCKAAMG